MFTICFNVVLPSLNRKCIITDPKTSINENKKIERIKLISKSSYLFFKYYSISFNTSLF
jgi:hypothetical protein